MVAGLDVVRPTLEALTAEHGATLAYDEIHPNVFGGGLGSSAYFERIAAVAAVIALPEPDR